MASPFRAPRKSAAPSRPAPTIPGSPRQSAEPPPSRQPSQPAEYAPAPPPQHPSGLDPSLLATLSALQRFSDEQSEEKNVIVPAAAGKFKKASKAEKPAPLHWLMQLPKEDLRGLAVYSPKCLQATKHLIRVFSYLDPEDLFRSAEVCRQWNVISEHDSLWIPHQANEAKRMERSLDNQRRRYVRMEKINLRVHVPAKSRNPKDFVVGVRKHSKLWSDQPMEFRGFWAKKAQENSRTAEVLKSQQDYLENDNYHTVGDIKCIIIDNGTAYIKAGFSAEMRPSLIVPSLLAHAFYEGKDGKDDAAWKGLPAMNTDEIGNIRLHPLGTFGTMVGPEVQKLACSSVPRDSKQKITRYRGSTLTIQEDTKETWDGWANMWGFIYNNLAVPGSKRERGVDPSQHPVLITQPILAPRFARERMSEILFEQFNVPAIHLAWAPIAAAYGADCLTGLCLDIGESCTQIVPIFEGTILEHAMKRVAHLSGAHMTALLSDSLDARAVKFFPGEPPAAKGYEDFFRQFQSTCIMRNIKENFARVSMDYMAELDNKDIVKEFTPNVPGAQSYTVKVGQEALDCGELFFAPKRILDDQDPSIVALPELVQQVVDSCPVDIRAGLLKNIMLSGGPSEMKGLIPRLEYEIKQLYKGTSVLAKSVEIKAVDDRQYRVWIGGAELARLGMGQRHVWLSRDLYDEHGAWALEKERDGEL